jgi:hypothetical protein
VRTQWKCRHCHVQLDYVTGRAFTGYVHSDTGFHICAGAGNLACPDCGEQPDATAGLDRYHEWRGGCFEDR